MINKCYDILKHIVPVKLRRKILTSSTWSYIQHKIYCCKLYQLHGKIILPLLTTNLADACNLKCEYCGTFSPYRSGMCSKEELLDSFTIWSQKLLPKEIAIGGGEPFLHPNYEELLLEIRRLWSKAKIMVISNGLLLPQVSDTTLKILAKNDISVRISQHIPDKKHHELLQDQQSRLTALGIRCCFFPSEQHWRVSYKLDEHGIPLPLLSNPHRAYAHCCSRPCVFIRKRTLWRCNILAEIYHGVQNGYLPPAWNMALKHRYMTSNDVNKDILEYLHGSVMKECTLCRDDFTHVEPCQIPKEQLYEIKSLIKEYRKAG